MENQHKILQKPLLMKTINCDGYSSSTAASSSTLCSTQNLLKKPTKISIISSTKALRIQQNIDKTNTLNIQNPNNGYPITKSFSALLRRRITTPLTKSTLKRRELKNFKANSINIDNNDELLNQNDEFIIKKKLSNADSAMSIGSSVSTGDIHSTFDIDMLKSNNELMLMTPNKPTSLKLTKNQNILINKNGGKRFFFQRSRNRTSSASSR